MTFSPSNETLTKPEASSDQPGIEIQRIYVREQTCKVPHAPGIFDESTSPEVNFEINVKHEPLKDDQYHVTLSVHVTGKFEQRTAFNIEVHQSGIFKLKNLDDSTKQWMLGGRCPGILLGYARKVVVDMMMDAGFTPLPLMMIDFEGMYMQRQQENADSTVQQPKVKEMHAEEMN